MQLHSVLYSSVNSDAFLNPYIQGETVVPEYFSRAVVHSFHIYFHMQISQQPSHQSCTITRAEI